MDIFDRLQNINDAQKQLLKARQAIDAAAEANARAADELVADFVHEHLKAGIGGVFEIAGHGKMELYDFGRHDYNMIFLHFTTKNTGLLAIRFDSISDLKKQVAL